MREIAEKTAFENRGIRNMTIEECYTRMGEDYETVLQRLGSERLVTKFALKFLEDKTYSELCGALKAKDAETAFRMAHTLKGISLNLGFAHLSQASSALTEQLRGRDLTVGYAAEFAALQEQYARTVGTIREMQGTA